MRLVGITSATKGALDNKVTVDIQMVTSTNLTAMAKDTTPSEGFKVENWSNFTESVKRKIKIK